MKKQKDRFKPSKLIRIAADRISSLTVAKPKVDYFKLTGWIFIALIAGVIILFIYLPDHTRLQKLKSKNISLHQDINRIKREVNRLKIDDKRLDSDPFMWEKIARQDLGVVKEGEIIVDIE